jgi:hypothetical protein
MRESGIANVAYIIAKLNELGSNICRHKSGLAPKADPMGIGRTEFYSRTIKILNEFDTIDQENLLSL